MSEDDDIYREIGKILLSIAPEDAAVVFLEAEISLEEDHCKLLFDYTGKSGVKSWFLPPSAKVDSELLEALARLRGYFEVNGLYESGKPWNKWFVELNLEGMKIKINFIYD